MHSLLLMFRWIFVGINAAILIVLCPIQIVHKLHNLGIRGNVLYWIMSHLSGIIVLIPGQVSIVGSLSFLIFKNFLPFAISLHDVFMYADDTSVIVSESTSEELEIKVPQICFVNIIVAYPFWN